MDRDDNFIRTLGIAGAAAAVLWLILIVVALKGC